MLKGKVALVTGASRGLGRSVALKMAEQGAVIGVNYYPGFEQDAESVVAEIRELGSDAVALQGDVTKLDDMAAIVDNLTEQFGGLDILINNAGITRDTLLMRMKPEEWDQVINTNLTGMFNATKAALKPLLKSENACIVNVASVVGEIGNVGQCNYSAAKAGVIGFTKTMARELAGRNVRVNAVAPGYIDTLMTAGLPEKIKEQMLAKIPLARFGQPEDVANLMLFLVSPSAAYITGQVINVDGGMVM